METVAGIPKRRRLFGSSIYPHFIHKGSTHIFRFYRFRVNSATEDIYPIVPWIGSFLLVIVITFASMGYKFFPKSRSFIYTNPLWYSQPTNTGVLGEAISPTCNNRAVITPSIGAVNTVWFNKTPDEPIHFSSESIVLGPVLYLPVLALRQLNCMLAESFNLASDTFTFACISTDCRLTALPFEALYDFCNFCFLFRLS